jgi:peptide deformylase
MSSRKILHYPDPRLRAKAAPVSVFDAALDRLVQEMLETMYASKAIGLAAPQLGVPLRVVVNDVSADGSAPEVFINPQILRKNGLAMVEESCLSVPGIVASVPRAIQLELRCADRAGQVRERRLEGLLAVSLLHELDHLDGVLFIDRLPLISRLRLWRPLRQARLRALTSDQVSPVP